MWVFKHAMYIKNFKKIIKQINTKHKKMIKNYTYTLIHKMVLSELVNI